MLDWKILCFSNSYSYWYFTEDNYLECVLYSPATTDGKLSLPADTYNPGYCCETITSSNRNHERADGGKTGALKSVRRLGVNPEQREKKRYISLTMVGTGNGLRLFLKSRLYS